MNLKSSIRSVIVKIYSNHVVRNMAYAGKLVTIQPKFRMLNPQYISMGDHCYFGPDCRIEAWDAYEGERFAPKIVFGKDVRINSTCHIGAIYKITIGDECLLGSRVLITDHSHGKCLFEEAGVHPSSRKLHSKGEVFIGARTWIGENAVILPGVHIGESAIIGASAVVTKDVPSFCVAAGNPARVVKCMKPEEVL